MPRAIELNLTDEDMTEITKATSWQEFFKAIGQLTSWGHGVYPKVTIERGDDTDILAIYYQSDGEIGQTHGAVWYGDYYGIY
jgi:hypothetical protein